MDFFPLPAKFNILFFQGDKLSLKSNVSASNGRCELGRIENCRPSIYRNSLPQPFAILAQVHLVMDSAPTIFAPPESARFLIELEARQDEVLRQLDDLNHRIEQAIVMGQIGIRRAEEVMQPNTNKPQAA